ncbi:MAG TPA: hypothetical protein VFC21_07585 [Bryobacteraceae bacterium]|nr:hypothetical protein [Bryobacteraceae bacterium]
MRDREGYCRICKFRKLEARFPWEFRVWAQNLTRLHSWQKAGYDLSEEGLTFGDWQALAVVRRFYEVKDIEAAMPRQQA